MNWKTILIVGLGILSIAVLYYCYKRYYNEGFQEESTNIVRSETFIGSSVIAKQYRFSGSVVTLRQMYSEIIRFLTDYRNYSGYANANSYSYYSNKYKKNLTFVDFPYRISNTKYWFPYTGMYGTSSDWITNFSATNNIDVYNSNIDRYINFIKRYSGSNKQKYIFNRSLLKASLLYRDIDLGQPPTYFNLTANTNTVIDTKITEVSDFNQNKQQWFTRFISYAQPNKNLYPPSDLRTDSSYHILYSGNVNNDKPPTLTYSDINFGKKAGSIAIKIPDRRITLEAAKSEQLELNIYGTELKNYHSRDFRDCMFLGSVFTNFDDQYNIDTVLRIPYNGIINGSNCYYSFNMFLPELTVSATEVNGIRKFTYTADTTPTGAVTYNTNLINLRNYNNNTIKILTDADLNVTSNQFITNVNTTFPSKSFETIVNSNDAYVGKITPEMMAKIPSLARRYITSWVFNRSTRLLKMHLGDVTGSDELNSRELEKAQYICLAIRNFGDSNLTNFLNIYANYYSFTPVVGEFTTHATISNVPNDEAAKRIVASSRIYNSYQYTGTTLSLSRLKTAGNVFNKGTGPLVTSNYFRDAEPAKSISGNLLSAITIFSDYLGRSVSTFPTNSITDVKNSIYSLIPPSSFRSLSDTAESSIVLVKAIMNVINDSCRLIVDYLDDERIDDAMITIKELKMNINTATIPSQLIINSITANGNFKTIEVTSETDEFGDPINSGINDYTYGDYISISGTTSYNNTYKILDICGNNIIISHEGTASNENPSAGRINIYSLKRYLNQAETSVNSLLTSINGSSIPQTNKDRIVKSINISKLFVDSFNTNIVTIINSIKSIYKGIDTIQMITKFIENSSSIALWSSTSSYDINNYVKVTTATTTTIYKSIKVNRNIPVTNSEYWLELTDNSIKTYIDTTITDITTAITNHTTFITNLETIRNGAITGDGEYTRLLAIRNTAGIDDSQYRLAQINIDNYLNTLQQYANAESIRKSFNDSRNSLDSFKTTVVNLKESIGTGSIANSIGALSDIEIRTLISAFNNLIDNNKLLPNYGALSNLNISDSSFLNSIAQLYYESSDGLYEMTTIYDVYMIGSNSVDIRFDKKQRLPNGRINNLNIQYLPDIQEYNRLLDIMDDGSWTNYYTSRVIQDVVTGQTLTKDAYDFYYEDLSRATSRLEPIFNPVYPIDQTINVKDLQIELSNLNTSNELITKILTGKLKGTERPYIPETQETVGYNYTDRLTTIQYNIQDKIYKIDTQISGILQGCARVFITPTNVDGKWTFPIDGMAIGPNAALTYNLAYNGNLEVDMANTQGNIGQYYPTIVYTKNVTPPIVCGDIKFINKAVSLFNQTAFLNLSSFTTQITGDDITKRQASDGVDAARESIRIRSSNFYDSNDGPLYVDKILGFQQVNSNTCYYKWQETQYDLLTNGVFSTNTGVIKRRTVNVQYQFMYDNLEYQNPRLFPDNNPGNNRPNEGFKYLTSVNVLFGDLYLSLYSWYAAATRDLFSNLNTITSRFNFLNTTQYQTLVTRYNTQSSNLSTLNHSTMLLFSTNLVIAKDFTTLFRSVTVIDDFDYIENKQIAGMCDPINIKPPVFTNNYSTITYNFRPGDVFGITTSNNESNIQAQVNAIDLDNFYDEYGRFNQNLYNARVNQIRQGRQTYGAYNKYRTVDVKDFFNEILNRTYTHDINKCYNPTLDPENCFYYESDKCRYTYTDTSSELYRRIESNIIIRENIRNSINNTNTQVNTATTEINSLLDSQITELDNRNVIEIGGRTNSQIYPELSNINKELTALVNERNNTQNNIETIRIRYENLLGTQTSDVNLPVYMANQVIPITKPLPEESPSLDDHFGQCPSYSCTSPVVMNSLVEQYNLDNDYDDTITSILKGATPNPFQCDYLVEVRKKNAIDTNTNLQFNRIRFTPIAPSYTDNRSAIYFSGNNYLEISNSCINLDSNNFTIDWFQFPVFDSDNPNPVIFSYGDNANLVVQFTTISAETIQFKLYINNAIFISVNLNYNQLNRWSYFAIVRNNSVITCYKDGFAFISKNINYAITNSSNIYIGYNGNSLLVGNTYFKGAIRNFCFNNYDALYMNNIFNTVPKQAIKNINTKLIIIDNNNTISNKIISDTNPRNIIVNSPSYGQITSVNETFITNGAILTELSVGNYTGNGIAIDNNNIYVSDRENHIIKRLNSDGTFTTVLGTGVAGKDPHGTAILQARLNTPSGLCYGNTLYVADTANHRICYVMSGNLYDLVININNVKYIAYHNLYIYYVNSTSKTIGRKRVIDPFDHTPTYISLSSTSTPCGITFDNSGNLYIADSQNKCIYKVLSGTTIVNPPIITGLNNPLSVATDSYNNVYIADKDNKSILMSLYNSSLNYNTPVKIVGNSSTSSLYRNGYARIIDTIPEFVLYSETNNRLYILDSRKVCYIEKANIPDAPSNFSYFFDNNFNISLLKIGSPTDIIYKFNKNLFTIQWFMHMQGNGLQTIFTFETSSTIQLGLIFDVGYTTTKMNLYVNGRVYPYNSQNNVSTPIEFNNSEIVDLWVHMSIVHNGSTLSIYKNSILVLSFDSTTFSFNTIDSPLELTIGNRLSPRLEVGFIGQIRSFMIYNKVARNYNNTIEPYTTSSFECIPNLILHIANGENSSNNLSITTTSIINQNSVTTIERYPYSTGYNPFKIKLNFSNEEEIEIQYTSIREYGIPFTTNLGALKNIISFNIYTTSHDKSVQQWLLEGSSNGTVWYTLHQQVVPYTSRFSQIYPKNNTYSSSIPVTAQRNIGGDIVKMTKRFQVATLIEDCSYVITSNVIDYDENSNEIYSKGVTSGNGFFIQDNTPYIEDSSGSDISGFQFIGNLLGEYESNVESIYDPIVSNSSTISGKMFDAYNKSRLDTNSAVGKLNTLNFYSSKFNNYDNLRSYINSNVRFRNTIFDGYSDSYSYMSNIIRFSIVNSSNIDIVFNKVDLTGLTSANIATGSTYNFTSRITTAGARYNLSISQGFLDLTATFLSNVMPFSNIFNDDFTSLTNPRNMNYKDRLNYREKLVPNIIPPSATVASFTIAITPSETERLTGLTGIIGSNIIASPAINTIEYILDNESGTLPIGKTNYMVQYVSATEVNSVIPATLDTTRSRTSIAVGNINTLITNFKTYFNSLFLANTVNGYPFNSIMKKVYGYRIASNILYLSCSVEYTNLDSTINYNKTPNISEFGTQLYYKVIFRTGSLVLAFEQILSTNTGTLTPYVDSTPLVIEGTTSNEIMNNYKKNLLWKQIQFIPESATSSRLTYSITQIQFFNSQLRNNRPLNIESLRINPDIINNFNLTILIDGVNTTLRNVDNIKNRIFTNTYVKGELTAIFNQGTSVDGFSFMTGYSLTNPEKWTIKGTIDGIEWIDLLIQSTAYTDPAGYRSFYKSPIFSFISNANISLPVTGISNISDETDSTNYRYLRIFAKSLSLNFQLINISLYNGNTRLTNITTNSSSTNFLFDDNNLTQNNVTTVQIFEAPANNNIFNTFNNVSLSIEFNSLISFNGISFITGIDVDKCMTQWLIQASLDGTAWNEIHRQEYTYINPSINYPHFFCRTPIFYKNGNIVNTSQPTYYDTKTWPVRYVRFRPIPTSDSGEIFEISQFYFFSDDDDITSTITSTINNNLLTYKNIFSATLSDITIFRGNYGVDTVNFVFNTPITFNGFSFMSGSQISSCVQLWNLEVSIDNNLWATFHSTNYTPYKSILYPSLYYRIPVIFFQNQTIIEKNNNLNKYYIVSGNGNSPDNTGTLFEINILLTVIDTGLEGQIIKKVRFTTLDYNDKFNGIISKRAVYDVELNGYNWSDLFNNTKVNRTPRQIFYTNEYPNTYGGNRGSSKILYELENKTAGQLLLLLLDRTPNPNLIPPVYGFLGRTGSTTITQFKLYTNKLGITGILFDNNLNYHLQQYKFWIKPSSNQGFINYEIVNYIDRFLLHTNKSFNSKLFRLIASNNKILPRKSYRVEFDRENVIVYLKNHVEIIGYTITTGLYSHLSDATSWKVFGMKKNEWILLDKQDNYNIPVERSYTLPPFYFNSNKSVKNDSIPDVKIMEDYYKKKINPFGKAVFKQYMFDNNKTYYMVFDEYDNNRNLINIDLIIGFVMGKGVVKKPIMYENPDGSFDAFNLKNKEMMSFWKKKVGLKLETKYLSDY